MEKISSGLEKEILEKDLQDLKVLRRRLSKEMDDLDTRIIGIRLAIDRAKEKERYQTDQDRTKERF